MGEWVDKSGVSLGYFEGRRLEIISNFGIKQTYCENLEDEGLFYVDNSVNFIEGGLKFSLADLIKLRDWANIMIKVAEDYKTYEAIDAFQLKLEEIGKEQKNIKRKYDDLEEQRQQLLIRFNNLKNK